MSQISTLSTFKLFARTAVRRMINRSKKIKIPNRKSKSADGAAEGAPAVRTATRHRLEQRSLFRRLLRQALPCLVLLTTVGMCFNMLFTIEAAVKLEESRTADMLQISADGFTWLKEAAAKGGTEERAAAVDESLKLAFSSSAAWIANESQELAKKQFEAKGLAGFAAHANDSRFGGTLGYLSPAGRERALRAVGLDLALFSLAMLCVAFGLSARNLTAGDPELAWLWQFPVSRRVLFSSKLIEYIFDTPIVLIMSLFYAAIIWQCGASFLNGLGIGAVLGLSAGVAAAAVRLAAETFLAQRLGRRLRGGIVAIAAALGGVIMLVSMTGSNSQYLIESIIDFANWLPEWCSWNIFTAGIGSNSMLDEGTLWWLVSPATSIVLAPLAVLLSVQLTSRGLGCSRDTARGAHTAPVREASRRRRFGTMVWKELMQLRRQPEFVGQILAAPLGLAFLLFIGGYQKVMSAAVESGTNLSVAVMLGLAYMLLMASSHMLTSELKCLWLLQCQPRQLADVLRSKARVWGTIALLMSVPFFGVAIAMLPSATLTILANVPFVLASLWFLAELQFGLTAIAASVTNEQTVRFQRSALLPLVVILNLSLALLNHSWWAELGALATLVVLNAAVRERQLVELSWLSEPVETPPKRVYAMHAVLALIGFEALQNISQIAFVQQSALSASAVIAISYFLAAVTVSIVFWFWMHSNKLTVPKLTRGPALRPILWGLLASCSAGFVTTMICRWGDFGHTAAYAIQGLHASAPYDKWFVLVMWVLAAPLFEEWIIRGMLYASLRRTWGIGLSVALSAVLFATLHPVMGAVALLTLGTMTALAYEKTGRLWPSITIHAGYNFMIWLLWFVC